MLFLTLLLGFITSYIGMITPSMLNITALKISIEKSKNTAIYYSVGVAFTVLFQGYFALFFLKVIYANPTILESIEIAAIAVFTILSIFFFWKAIQDQKEIVTKKMVKSGFVTGMGLSLINMFAIPFYCGVGALLNMYGFLELNVTGISFFLLGSAFGTFFILYHYVLLAEKIKSRIKRFSKYLNFVLGGITGIVALISLIKIL